MLSSKPARLVYKNCMSATPPNLANPQLSLNFWWLTALLMSLNIGLFLWQISTGVDASQPSSRDALAWGADFAPLTFLAEPWRLLSSMFFHFGMIHLMLNMWALYIFGSVSEQLMGRYYFIGLYFLAGLSGSLLSAYLDLRHTILLLNGSMLDPNLLPRVSAGASGAVMGLGAALTVIALFPRLPQQRFILAKKSLVLIMLLNLFIGFMTSGINNAAHIGGMIMGGMLALLWYMAQRFHAPWLKLLSLVFAAALCYLIYQALNQWVMQIQPFWQELLDSMLQQLKL